MNAIEQNKLTIWQMFKTIEQKGFIAQSRFFADQIIYGVPLLAPMPIVRPWLTLNSKLLRAPLRKRWSHSKV